MLKLHISEKSNLEQKQVKQIYTEQKIKNRQELVAPQVFDSDFERF